MTGLTKDNIRIAFVSTSISPYCIAAREKIDQDERIITKHIFARKIEPGRQWNIDRILSTFKVSQGFTLSLGKKFIYIPIGIPIDLFRFKPDVIVSEQLGSLLIFTYIYALITNTPVILRWEGTSHTERNYSSGVRYKIRKLLARLAAGFICYSSGAVDYILGLNSAGNCEIIPYSVDDAMFYAPEDISKRHDNIFLFVGQITERKGIVYLIEAFKRVLDIAQEAELWIVGDGDLKLKLESNTANYNNIKWFGFKSAKEISELMRNAGIFVCPTLKDHGPVVQIEAALSGMAIISSVYSGNAERIIEEDVNGYIVDPVDVDSMVKAMIKIMQSKEKEKMYMKSVDLGRHHTASVEAKITIDAVIKLYNAHHN